MKLPHVWNEGISDYVASALKLEAAALFRIHQLPEDIESWKIHSQNLRRLICDRKFIRP